MVSNYNKTRIVVYTIIVRHILQERRQHNE